MMHLSIILIFTIRSTSCLKHDNIPFGDVTDGKRVSDLV